MNIIANNCIGARLYQIANTEYNNPFMWCVVPPSDMIQLIVNFYNINFARIKIEPSDYYTRTEFYRSMYKIQLGQPYFIFKIIVDDLINIHYVHYRWSPIYNGITKIGLDAYSNHIWDYVVDTYIRRVQKMIQQYEAPIFVCNCSDSDYTLPIQYNIIDALHQCPSVQRLVMITDYYNELGRYDNTIKVLKLIRPIETCTKLAKAYYHDIIAQ